MDFWVKDINVSLKVRKFRVGGIQEDVDLGSVPLKYTASSIRGLLRKAVKKALNSLNLKNAEESEIFGKDDFEGKVQVLLLNQNEKSEKNVRHGIKIDPLLGSVKHGHLFSYSFLEIEEIKFILRPLIKITREEAKILYYGLNYLRYDTIGGFGSKGMGLIEDVEIDENFKKFVEVKV
ncbi:MAG: RAMP superfamily CRISPR-associated protein [Archaeoglobaceae archaeon]